MGKKILISLLVIIVAGFATFSYAAHIMFVGFEHRDDHNGVGWGQFSKSLKKHIESTDFAATDFGHYEGKVWFGELKSENRSIKFGMFTRTDFEDPRDMQTLKHAKVYEINQINISCTDRSGHEHSASIDVQNITTQTHRLDVSSIANVLDNYHHIEKTIANYNGGYYAVEDNIAQDLPKWLNVNIGHNCCGAKDHVVKQISCYKKAVDKMNDAIK